MSLRLLFIALDNMRFNKTNKYHNKITYVNGIRFASKKEAERYKILKIIHLKNQIQGLTLQPRFDFPMGFSYIADFSYMANGQMIVEDVKGIETGVFKLKKKCFEYFYPFIELKIVR